MNARLTGTTVEHAMDAVPVLMYHSIATGAAPGFRRFTIHPSEFTAHMDYLRAGGYSPVTAADLAASRMVGRPLPARPVVLTFDDAFDDFVSVAMPILRERGFPSTLFVPTAYVGGPARWLRGCGEESRVVLSWQALREVTAEGVEVASHSHTHPQLDRVSADLIRDEVYRSRDMLEDNLGLGVDGFAYPFGYWNRAARAAVAAAGYRYSCAVAEIMTSPADDVLALPRLTVNSGIGVNGLASLLRTQPTRAIRRVAAAKRVIWQALRRGVRTLGGDPLEGSPP